MTFVLTSKAKTDLKSIAKYTKEQWGIQQRNTYLKDIDNAFHLLDNNPNLGLNCDYRFP